MKNFKKSVISLVFCMLMNTVVCAQEQVPPAPPQHITICCPSGQNALAGATCNSSGCSLPVVSSHPNDVVVSDLGMWVFPNQPGIPINQTTPLIYGYRMVSNGSQYMCEYNYQQYQYAISTSFYKPPLPSCSFNGSCIHCSVIAPPHPPPPANKHSPLKRRKDQ